MARKHGFFRPHVAGLSGIYSTTLREGGGYTAEAQALFARFTTPATIARKTLINNLIVTLKNGSVWQKLDCLYLLAAADSQAALLNWKSTSFNLSGVNSPTFTADQGYAGNGSSSYLTNGTALTGLSQYQQDSASMGLWSRTAGQGAAVDIGLIGTTYSFIQCRDTSNQFNARGNASSGTQSVSNTDGTGFFAWSRRSSTGFDMADDLTITAKTNTSAALSAVNMAIGAGSSGFSSRQIAMGFWGGGLTGVELATLYNAVLAYLQGVGAA